MEIDALFKYRFDTEREVEEFIGKMKEEAKEKFYEILTYSSTKKQKTKNKVVIDEGFEVKIKIKYNDFFIKE